MILIPALEILGGKVVRLADNDREKPIVLAEDPVEEAQRLRDAGANFFHVLDLDAAFDQGNNDAVLRQLADRMIPFQIRGGIRTAERADDLLWMGADAVVPSTLFYRQPDAAAELVQRFGRRVLASIDVLDGKISTIACTVGTDREPDAALELLRATGVHTVIYHKVNSGAADPAPDMSGLRRILEFGAFDVHMHCSIQTRDELLALIDLLDQGLAGVVVDLSAADVALDLEKSLRAHS